MALAGVIVTVWYDLLTNLAYPISVGFDTSQIAVTLMAGIPFAAIHIGSNCLVFLLLGSTLMDVIDRHHLQER